MTLLAAPNVSEGRDLRTLEAIGEAFEHGGARLLDRHSDPDHHRAVFTLAAERGRLAPALLEGARETLARIDLCEPRGSHPHVGAIDVVPIVFTTVALRGAACAEALVTADLLASQLELPVFLYGALAGGRPRAELRRGGPAALARRVEQGELRPDFGPAHVGPRSGATLVAARPPLVAFNVELAPPATIDDARAIATLIRDGGPEGLPGLRAIGVELASRNGSAQVSMNVEDPFELPLARIVAAIGRHGQPIAAEIVGLAPQAALKGFPEGLALRGFDPARHLLENALLGL